MAFPWTSEAVFEDGTLDHFDAEVDTDGKLDFPHYSELFRQPRIAGPYSGAYAMRVDLSGGTNDAYVQETGDWDLAATGSLFWRFMLWFGNAPVMADGDIFAIWQLWSATSTVEASCGIQYTDANGYRMFINETAAAAGATFLPLTLDTWHAVELTVTIDDGGSNDGTVDMWLDGGAATQITGLNQGAITSGVVGALGIDAGTTKGVLLFDSIIADDARIHRPTQRHGESVLLTKSGHVFVGPGKVENITLMSGAGTDCVASIHDTDVADVNDAFNLKGELKNTANNEVVDPAGMPVFVHRGCYVQLSGTTPRALVQIGHAGISEGAMRAHASRR